MIAWLRKLLERKPREEHVQVFAEQAVIVHLKVEAPPHDEEVAALEQKLATLIQDYELGEYDGNEFGPGSLTLYMYGVDAEKIFCIIEPVLRNHPLRKGGHVTLRAGSPGASVRIIDLDDE